MQDQISFANCNARYTIENGKPDAQRRFWTTSGLSRSDGRQICLVWVLSRYSQRDTNHYHDFDASGENNVSKYINRHISIGRWMFLTQNLQGEEV